MVVSAAGNHVVATRHQLGGQNRGVLTTFWAYSRKAGCEASCRATAIPAVVWSCGPPCRPGNTALSSAGAWVVRQRNMPPADPAGSCVSWCDHVGVGNRRRMGAACHETGNMAMSTAKRAPTSRAISAMAAKSTGGSRLYPGPQQLRPFAASQVAHLVEINTAGVLAHAVLDRLEIAAGDGHVPAVSQMAAHGQGQPHHLVTGLQEGEVDRQVGR